MAGMLYYLEWPETDVRTLIEAVMEFTGDEDKTRLRTVHATFLKGEKGGKITGSNTLRALLGDDRAVARILEWAGNAQAQILQDYNERFAVVMLKGKFRVAEMLGMEQGGPPTLFAKNDFLDMMATDTAPLDDKKVPKAKLWLAHPRRRAYRTMDFIPGEDDTTPILNLWTGWGVEPDPDNSCQAWLDFLYDVIAGRDEFLYDWTLNWMANIVREPRMKALTAPVLIGKQGAGKSLVVNYFGRILGPAYVVITNEEHIYGRFNKHLATALLLHSEEALYGGDRKHRGMVKSLITDEYRIFEQKGVDAERIHNHLRLILTSNEMYAAPAEADDRRFTVIDMEGRKGTPEIFAAVVAEMNNKGPASLLHYLLHVWKYDPSVARVNVKNKALANMKFMGMDPTVSWWYDCLESGQMLPDYLSWAARGPGVQEWPQVVSSPALYIAMETYAKSKNVRYYPNSTSFALILNKLIGCELERRQKYFNNPMSDYAPAPVKLLSSKQNTVVNMPDLDACRKAFCAYIGHPLEWPREVDEEDKPAAYRKF